MRHNVSIIIVFALVFFAQEYYLMAQSVKSAASQYENVLMRAEQLLQQKNYKQAKSEYENALKIDLSASYPRIKLQQIKQFYTDPLDEARYNQFIRQGDQFFGQQDFDKAREQYDWALVLKPDENHPRSRISEIEESKVLRTQKQQPYNSSIAVADSLFALKKYQEATNEYLYASGLLPKEAYPRKIIDEINKIMESARKDMSAYDKIIADADQAYMVQDYFSALSGYQKALRMRPGEKYPANMIKRIDDSETAKLSAEEAYAKLITNADKHFASGDYETARTNYEQAGRIKPAEISPKKRLTEIDAIFAERANRAENIAKALEQGQRHFGNKEYSLSLAQYEIVSKLDPNNKEANEKITTINALLKEEADFTAIITQADQLFTDASYADARKKYQGALVKQPGHNHATQRIADIDSIVAALTEKDLAYQKVIGAADAANQVKDYENALAQYKIAGNLKPAETYPKQQISAINTLLAKAEDDRNAYEAAIASGDQSFAAGRYQQSIANYQEALKYGQPGTYAQARIDQARSSISQAETDDSYKKAIDKARLEEEKNQLAEALKTYQVASSIKPTEVLPKDKISELGAIIEAEKRKVKEAYEKVIANGNRYYETKVFDQAIEAYLEAAALIPDVAYPTEMIAKIRKYINERLLAELVADPITFTSEEERKFNFKPVEMRMRRNNYVIIRVNFQNTQPSRFFLNYGLNDQRSGGIVVRNPGGRKDNEFIIRISAQDRWYRVDNNWLSLYAEGAGFEITQFRIAAGD